MITLYGSPLSPFVRKVRLFLEEKKLPYTLEIVRPRFTPPSPEFLKISPLGKIPALRDGDFAISDSSVICAYLEKRYPELSGLPKNACDYARVLWFEEYADTVLADAAVFKVFFNKTIAPRLNQTSDTAAINQGLTVDLPRCFDYLEQQLQGGKHYLVGDHYTLADMAIVSVMVNFYYAECEVDPQRWPNLSRYLLLQFENPSLKRYMAEEQKMLQTIPSNVEVKA